MSDQEEPEPPPRLDSVGAASCFGTMLALPIMFFFMLLFGFLLHPIDLDPWVLAKIVLSLPMILALGAFGLAVFPASTGIALVLIFTAAVLISRRGGWKSRTSRKLWLLAGALLGALVALSLYLVPGYSGASDMPFPLPVGLLVLAGALTGMAALLICRHLIRQFDG